MKKTLCQIAVCVLLSSLGEAAQVNYHGYGNAEGTGNIPVYFSVTQFDPSMGTLTGVSLSINESNIIHWNFNNVNAADTWTIALANGLVTVHQNGGVLTDLTAPAALDPTPYAVAADGLTIVTPEVGNFNFVPGYSAPAALAVFTGNGVVDYTVSFSGDWSVGGGLQSWRRRYL